MELRWTNKAFSDLTQLYEFLAAVNQRAAEEAIRKLVNGPDTLLTMPRLGEQLEAYEPREVRRIWIGQYEMRYEIKHDVIYILRIWHSRENCNGFQV